MADASRFEPYINDRRFQLLVNSVTDHAIYMLDREGFVATWNEGARQLKGYEEAEIVGRHFSQFFPEEARAAGQPQRAMEIAAEKGRFETEDWRVRKDGTRFWANVVLDRIVDDRGKLIGFAKVTRDRTERRRAQQALFESEQRFQMLVQGVVDYAIYMLDPEGRVTNWNSGAEIIKGYSADEIIGQHFSRFYTAEDREKGAPQRALQMAREDGKYENEAPRVRKDGSTFWASVVIDPIFGPDGELVGYAKITRDVTERRKAQEELEVTRAALFQSQKLQALGELTGGIAHDFNNLMTVIRGSADLLSRDNLPEDKRNRYLQAIKETADRAATLTGHLLAFGRRQPLKPEVIDLNMRLDALADLLSRTLGEMIAVRLELSPSLWFTEVDVTQLENALLNAAVNARDAMSEGGVLTIRTRNLARGEHEFVAIAIADTGCGMAPEVLQRVFEPFFTTKAVGKGTGLGLSQIHGFTAQTGGRAEIESLMGQGTTLHILLPRSHKQPCPIQQEETPPIGGGGRTLLLVEDNDHVRDFAHQLLDDLDYRVVTAASAEEALEVLDEQEIDLIFSDVVMPGRSGVELARIVRGTKPHMPILLASGFSEELVAGAATDYELLHKPYDARSLSAALDAAFRRGS